MSSAQRQWAQALEALAIPSDILAGAPESPYGFPSKVFAQAADDALSRESDSPSDRRARQALPAGGTVLDVGCGAGAASLRLVDLAADVVGVDADATLLAAFSQRMRRLGVSHHTVEGRWPAVADTVAAADVAVCHHVAYNVPDLAAFLAELTDHARRRVVVELTAVHPLTWMNPYWEALHGLTRPAGPRAADAAAVIHELGLRAEVERWQRPMQMLGENAADRVAATRRRLCVGSDRDAEVARLLAEHPPPVERGIVTLWWDPGAG